MNALTRNLLQSLSKRYEKLDEDIDGLYEPGTLYMVADHNKPRYEELRRERQRVADAMNDVAHGREILDPL